MRLGELWKSPRLWRNASRRAWHVWRRDLDVYMTTWQTNFLPPLLEPVLYILAFGFGMGKLIGTVTYRGHDVPYLDFMAPGVISVAIMFWSYFETTYSSFVRMYYQRTFDAIVATPLLVEDVIAGEWLWGATKSVMAGVLMLGMIGLFRLVHWPSGLLVIAVSLLGGLLFSALGLITTALVPKIDNFNLSTFLFIFPMFLFSGTFFPIEILPTWAFWLAMTMPLTHISILVRGACLAEFPPYAGWSLLYLLLLTPICASIGLFLMRRRLVK